MEIDEWLILGLKGCLLFVSTVFTMRWTVSLVASESSELAPKGVGRLQSLIIGSLKYQGFISYSLRPILCGTV